MSLRAILTGLLVSMAAAAPALAQSATDWHERDMVRTRLIAASPPVSAGAGAWLAGWEVEIDEGWKTYWRTPGEAGLPPVFDWSGSENVRDVNVVFPMPERFTLFGIQTYGYADKLLLPVLVTPERPGEPVILRTNMSYMVCEDICIPFEEDFELVIAPDTPAGGAQEFARRIEAALQRVPLSGARAELASLTVRQAQVYGPPGHQRLAVRVGADVSLAGAEVIVELPGTDARIGPPDVRLRGDGRQADVFYSVTLRDEGSGLAGQRAIITFADGWGQAIETEIMLAGQPARPNRTGD